MFLQTLLATVATATVFSATAAEARPNRIAADAVLQTPGLVAFWTFGEEAGQPRVSVGTNEKHALREVGGPIARVVGGPFSGYSAELNGKQYFKIPYADTGDLNIAGPDAQVSMFAVVRIIDLEQSRSIAGMWSEGKGEHDDTGTRQYALLMNMPAYGGSRRLVPHISSEGGVTRRADGSAFPWCADYAVSHSEVPEEEWCSLGFTYDGTYIRAYINGELDVRPLDPVKDNRTDRYFTHEGPGGKDRGMNPYFHGRGIFRYDPVRHAQTKPGGGSDFTVGARYAVSSMLGKATRGKFGGLAVFDRALTDAEMKKLHAAAYLSALNAAPAACAGPTKAGPPTVHDVFRGDKLTAIDAEITQAIADAKIVGGVLWMERDGVPYHKAYGNRALMPEVEPMTEDTIFDVASVTKVVATTSAAMLCVQRGLMGLDDPVSKHLHEFTGEGREKITLRYLLLHTSGLQLNLNGTKRPLSRNPAEAYALAYREKPMFEPGSAFAYSSVGTMVLGMVIERAAGRKIDAFCSAEIFHPLKMNDTQFRPSGESLRRVSPSSAPQRGLVDDNVAREMGGVSGHAGLFTTASDLARFARMMLNINSGELDGVRVFNPETIQLMTSVQSPPGLRNYTAGNLPVLRGLGWDIDTPYRAQPRGPTLSTLHRGALFPVGGFGHTGWTGQMLWIDPFSRTFVIFLCNRYGPAAEDTRPAVYQLHHRLSTLAAEAVKGFDFKSVPGALPPPTAAIDEQPGHEVPARAGMMALPSAAIHGALK